MSYPSQPSIPENPPAMRRRPVPENKKSLLLSHEENQCIFDILGKGRQTLATAVAQVLVPTLDHQRWQIKDTGVLCLVRDTAKRSYFIQLFSLRTKSMVFRQEIYNQFEYKMPLAWFLTFEGENQTIGINFADRVEAASYKEALDNKLESKRQRKARNSRNFDHNVNNAALNLQNNNVNMVHSNVVRNKYPNGTSAPAVSSAGFQQLPISKIKDKKGKGKDKDKKKLLRKEDIGRPMDFRHVQHVGWDPNRGFDLDGVDGDYQKLFEQVGVSHNDLEDEQTRQFIYNFIENHGGAEAVKQAVSQPSRGPAPPLPPPPSCTSEPPPVPVRHPSLPALPPSNKPAAPPPPPSRPVPPPPPSSTYPAQCPPPPVRSTSGYPQQVSRNNGSQAPPPPPPPPMNLGPPPPPMPSNNGDYCESDSGFGSGNIKQPAPVEDDRSALMKQIQKGVSLKKIDTDQAVKRSSGTLSDCLNQIKTGVDLKKIPENSKPPPLPDAMDGLAGALARALAERSRAINPDSSSSGEDEDDVYDEDEWD